MNIKEALLAEHSRAQMLKIVAYIGDDKNKFAELMKLFFTNEYRISQRAAWSVNYSVQRHSELIKPYLKDIILNMENKVHDAVKRNTLRLLQTIDIPNNLSGILTKIAFDFLYDKKEPVAVKVFAMQILANMCKKEPDLKPELIALINLQYDKSSAGFQSRARCVIAELKKIK